MIVETNTTIHVFTLKGMYDIICKKGRITMKKLLSRAVVLTLIIILAFQSNVFAESSLCNGTDTRNMKPSATKEQYISQVLKANHLSKAQKELMIKKLMEQ